jgi:hypothetical protein
MSTYLDLVVPFSEKDQLKKLYRLKWSSERKMWYTEFPKVYSKLRMYNLVKLQVYFPKKEEIKQIGCKWSAHYKCWYCSQEFYDSNKNIIDSCCIKPRPTSPTIDEKLFLIDTDDECVTPHTTIINS